MYNPNKFDIIKLSLFSTLVVVLVFDGRYLLPWTLNSLFGNNSGATAVLFIFGWFTLSIAQYSLTATGPPEPAIFRTMDVYELSPLSRPFYVIVCLVFHVIHW